MIHKFNTEAEWLAYRNNNRIGASEIADIEGVGFNSPLELWAKKQGYKIPVDPATEALFRQGHEDELPLAAWFAAELPCVLDDPGEFTVYEHPEHSWAFATPDRVMTRRYNAQHEVWEPTKAIPVELKSPRYHLDEWADGPPLKYQLQLQWQMWCMSAPCGYIVARLRPEQFWYYDFQPHWIKYLVPKALDFLQHLHEGTEPSVIGTEGDARALRALHPNDNGETIDLPDYDGVAHSLLAAQDEERAAKAKVLKLKTRLQQAMGDATFAQCGDVKLSFKTSERAGYTVSPTTTRTFRISKPKQEG